jgi:hypothetical protein
MNVFESHQKKIALATLKMHTVGATVMGGMTHQEAVQYLKRIGMSESSITVQLQVAGHSPEDIAEFMKEPT